MTDDEVMQWLSEEQRFHFYEQPDDVTRGALRALAETRKALALFDVGHGACGEVNQSCTCPLCRELPHGHADACIFTTMPRPKK